MHFATPIIALASATAAFAVATPQVVTPNVLSTRSTSQPRMVIYTDDYISGGNGLPSPSDLTGYNTLILAFHLVSGPADQALAWSQLSSSARSSAKSAYNKAGITLMVSAFGSTDTPTSNGVDAADIATTQAKWVKSMGLQGIDCDYEDMPAIDKADGKAEKWLITYTQTLRKLLPSGQYLITHAPVAPWFSPMYKAGAYTKVHKEAGNDIDWYNVQFYNQGAKEYTDCDGLFYTSSGTFPKSAVFEINSEAGVPMSKIIIGKPSSEGAASNGYMSSSDLAKCINKAGTKWTGGTMFWEYESKQSNVNLIADIVKAFQILIPGLGDGSSPVISGGGDEGSDSGPSSDAPASTTAKSGSSKTKSASPTTTKKPAHSASSTASASVPTSTGSSSSSGSCDGASAWSTDEVYNGGREASGDVHYVTYKGATWGNKWWTQGDEPGTEGDSDPWEKISCSSKRDIKDLITHDIGLELPVQPVASVADEEAAKPELELAMQKDLVANVSKAKRSHHGRRARMQLSRLES